MAGTTVHRRSDAEQLAGLLDSREVASLIAELEATRWTGRPGYPIRAMVGMALVKALYAIPTWTRVVALVAEHAALAATLGAAPLADACYRFTAKLRRHGDRLDACIASVLTSLRSELPDFGKDVAVDGSDLPAYANGQRFLYTTVPSGSGSPTSRRRGATARPSPPARAAATLGSSSTLPSALARSFRWRGTFARPGTPRLRLCPNCSTPWASTASGPRR